MYTRWFSQSVYAKQLFDKLRPGAEGVNVKFKNIGQWVGSVVGIILGIFLIIALFMAAANHENKRANKPNYAPLAGLAAALCAVGGLTTWAIVGSGNRRLRKRLMAFDEATEKYDIKNCGNFQLVEDYGLPLFHTENVAGCPAKSLNAWLCGNWQEDEFAWLQGGHLIDPLFRTLGDNAAINVGLMALFGSKGRRVNRLRRMGFEAIVFSEELQLPDIILGHYQIVETSYTKQAVQTAAHPLPGLPIAAKLKLWGAVSDPRGGTGIYGALADIVNSRRCLIQVINGRVVVFLNYFLLSDSSLVGNLSDVEREMKFAHTIFQRLKYVAQAKNSPADAPVDTTAMAEAFKPSREFRPAMGKVVAGLCMALFGGMILLGASGIDKAVRAEIQHTVEVQAEVQKRGMEPGESNAADSNALATARPWIDYSYAVDGEAFQGHAAISQNKAFVDVADAKSMLSNCYRGMKFNVWIDPDSPQESSLVKTTAKAGKLKAASDIDLSNVLTFAKLMMFGGLGLLAFGFFGDRQKAVIPDFSDIKAGADFGNIGSQAAFGAPVEETPEWGNLSSAKYFTQSTGVLD